MQHSKLISLLFLILFLCTFSACKPVNGPVETAFEADSAKREQTVDTDTDSAQTAKNNSDTALGRYLESSINTPDGLLDLYAIQLQEDNSLLLIGRTSSQNLHCFSSTDQGATWNELDHYPASALADGSGVFSAAANSQGTLFICHAPIANVSAWGIQYEYTFSYCIIDADGTVTDLTLPDTDGVFSNGEISTVLTGTTADGDGLFIAHSDAGLNHAYVVEAQNGTLKNSYEMSGGRVIITACTILIPTDTDILQYASDTGAPKDPLELPDKLNNNTNIYAALSEDTYAIANISGLFTYTADSDIAEQYLDGSAMSAFNSSYVMWDLYYAGQEEYIISYRDDYRNLILKRYYYDAAIPAAPDTEIVVYSLRDNADIRNLIQQFMLTNPDYQVTLQIGMSDKNFATTTEAVNTLNTAILAGTGPDVIVTNELPLESYIKQDALQDLSSVVQPYADRGEIWENIIRVYETDDTIPAIPLSFKVPVILADQEARDSASSLSGLLDYLSSDAASSFTGENLISNGDLGSKTILLYLTTLYGSSLLTDDTINQADLAVFLKDSKAIYERLSNNWSNDYEAPLREEAKGTDLFYQARGAGLIESIQIIFGRDLLSLGWIGSAEDLSGLEHVSKSLDHYDYQLVNDTSGAFMPSVTVALSARAVETKGSLAFIDYMLSEDGQDALTDNSFPVNRASFRTRTEEPSAEVLAMLGTNLDNFTWPDDSAFVQLEDWISELDTSVFMNHIIFEALYEQALLYFMDQSDLDSVVESFSRKMNLYLAE